MDLFGTAGIRGGVTDRVTPDLVLRVGNAVAAEIRSHETTSGEHERESCAPRPTVVLARDGRVTGPALASAMAAGLASGGVRVLEAGRLPTPALAYASTDRYGVMLTASHNPPADNGIKLFRDGVEFDDELETAIEQRMTAGPEPVNWSEWTTERRVEPLDGYRKAVVDYATRFGGSLDGLRVAVDCGNGMGAPATPAVLGALGATVTTLNGNVDGHFSGRGSKPTPESLRNLREFIADANGNIEEPGLDGSGVAFGIGHDGDADRVVIVGADGDIVHEDTVLAILAERYTRRSEAADPVVVTTPNASGRIDERVRAAGGRVVRVRLGALHEGIASVHSNAEGDETRVVFAAEPWKHVHVPFGGWIDGVCSAAVFARLVADVGLDTLCDPVSERPYRKVSVDCPDTRKPATMRRLETALPAAFPDASIDTDHGVRLQFSDASWVLVRPSGTEPYVRIYAESDDVDELVSSVESVVTGAISES